MYWIQNGAMNISALSLQKARHLAAHLRTTRHAGTGWNHHSDRDLARESQEIYVIAQYRRDAAL